VVLIWVPTRVHRLSGPFDGLAGISPSEVEKPQPINSGSHNTRLAASALFQRGSTGNFFFSKVDDAIRPLIVKERGNRAGLGRRAEFRRLLKKRPARKETP